jgi:hypothetical protein
MHNHERTWCFFLGQSLSFTSTLIPPPEISLLSLSTLKAPHLLIKTNKKVMPSKTNVTYTLRDDSRHSDCLLHFSFSSHTHFSRYVFFFLFGSQLSDDGGSERERENVEAVLISILEPWNMDGHTLLAAGKLYTTLYLALC